MHRPVSVALLRVASQNAQQLSVLMGFAGVITFVYYMRGDKVQYHENEAYKQSLHSLPHGWAPVDLAGGIWGMLKREPGIMFKVLDANKQDTFPWHGNHLTVRRHFMQPV